MMFKSIIRKCIFLSLFGINCLATFALQDTIRIDMKTAEKQFLEKNLQILAQKYDIEISKAEEIQAKLFDNPSFSSAIDIFNPDNNKWFDATKATGQYAFSIEQVIRLGGKRNKAVALAKEGTRMSENQFYDLLRTLQFSLHSVFYETYFTLRSIQAFDTQIELLQQLQETYKELEKRGVIPLNELIRIRSLLYSLQSDKLGLQSAFNEKQSELQLLLQDNNAVYIPLLDSSLFILKNPNDYLLPKLTEEARTNRVDLKIAENELNIRKKNYALQKSIAIPDVTVGAEYDKQGSFTNNLFSMTLAFDLPVFNRNQGNIRAAKATVMQQELLVNQKQLEIENQVQKTYVDALNADKISRSIDPGFESDLQLLLQNITENFRKKNISLLEFTDFYESYRDNVIKINQIQNQKAQAMEELRFVVGGNLE